MVQKSSLKTHSSKNCRAFASSSFGVSFAIASAAWSIELNNASAHCAVLRTHLGVLALELLRKLLLFEQLHFGVSGSLLGLFYLRLTQFVLSTFQEETLVEKFKTSFSACLASSLS